MKMPASFTNEPTEKQKNLLPIYLPLSTRYTNTLVILLRFKKNFIYDCQTDFIVMSIGV